MQYQHLKVIFRWSWLLVLIPVLAALIAYFYMDAQPATYEATSVLLVGSGIDSPSPDMDSLRSGAYLMATYAELPRTDSFLEQLRNDLGLTISKSAIAKKIDMRALVDTQILKIVVQDDDPDRAVAIANGVAAQLHQLSPPLDFVTALRDRMETQALRIETDIEDTQLRLAEISRQLEIEQDDARRAALLQQLAGEERRLSDSNQALVDLFELIQLPITNRIEILDPAIEADESSTPVGLYMLLAAGAGIVISMMLGALLIALENNLVSRQSVLESANTPLWGVVSLTGEKKSQQYLNNDGAAPLPQVGQYHELSAQMLHQQAARNLNCLLLASVERDNLASEVAANLAIALARTNRNVLLLDADMHSNFVERFFELSNGSNLAQVLYKPDTSMAIAPVGGIPQLAVLPSGGDVSHAFDLVASPQMNTLLDKAATAADIVLVAAPPLATAEEGLALAAYVDAVVLVARERRTSKATLRRAVERLETVGGHVAGVILAEGGWI